MGIYQGKSISMPIPTTIPKLGFHLVLSNIKPNDNLSFSLVDPNDKHIAKYENINVDMPQKKPAEQSIFDLVFTNIQVKNEGIHKLIIVLNKNEKGKQAVNVEINKTK